jgi:hypothetical protein
MRCILRHLSVAILLTFLSACGKGTYTPNITSDFNDAGIPKFTSNNEVVLLAGQAAAEPLFFWREGGYKSHYTDLQSCTNVVVATTKRELSKRGMRMTEKGERTLKMTVTNIESYGTPFLANGGASFDTSVELDVQAGNGYSKKYFSKFQSWVAITVDPSFQFDAALGIAVADMLSDPKIVEYLTK